MEEKEVGNKELDNIDIELFYKPKSYYEEKVIAFLNSNKNGLTRSPFAQWQRERTSSFDSISSSSGSERVRNKRHSLSFLEQISKPFKEISLSRAPSFDILFHPKDDIAKLKNDRDQKSPSNNAKNSPNNNLKKLKCSEEIYNKKLSTTLFFHYDDEDLKSSELSDIGLRHQSLLEADGDSQSLFAKPLYIVSNNLKT
ncbi:uncharacterized protein LOC101237748 isoform X1 [Hydra vulgaris]